MPATGEWDSKIKSRPRATSNMSEHISRQLSASANSKRESNLPTGNWALNNCCRPLTPYENCHCDRPELARADVRRVRAQRLSALPQNAAAGGAGRRLHGRHVPERLFLCCRRPADPWRLAPAQRALRRARPDAAGSSHREYFALPYLSRSQGTADRDCCFGSRAVPSLGLSRALRGPPEAGVIDELGFRSSAAFQPDASSFWRPTSNYLRNRRCGPTPV